MTLIHNKILCIGFLTYVFWNFVVLVHRNNKLEVEDAELNTPLLMAAAEGSSEVMGVLIKEGAKLTCTDGKGNNIVHLMVSSDNADVMKVSLCIYFMSKQ